MTITNEEIRHRNKDAAERAALFWIQLANERQSEIVRQLLGLSSVLLPLSASIVISKVILNQIEIHLLVLSWILFLSSIAAGFIQIYLDSKFFVMISRDSSKRQELWSEGRRSVLSIERDVEALGKVSGESTSLPQKVQAVTFFLGLIFLMIVGSLILFNASSFAHSSAPLDKYNKLHKFSWTLYQCD